MEIAWCPGSSSGAMTGPPAVRISTNWTFSLGLSEVHPGSAREKHPEGGGSPGPQVLRALKDI